MLCLLPAPGTSSSSKTARSLARKVSPSAFMRSYTSGVRWFITTSPATMVMGLALNVPACARGPLAVGSKSAMMSLRPPHAPTGMPPPIILPNVVMSGMTPNILLRAARGYAEALHLVEYQHDAEFLGDFAYPAQEVQVAGAGSRSSRTPLP